MSSVTRDMTRNPVDQKQKRGSAADEAVQRAIGWILCDRAAAAPFNPKISVMELARASGTTRPSIYRRRDVVSLLENLALLVSADRNDSHDNKAVSCASEAHHEAELAKIASEKMELLARIHELEERLDRALARATLPRTRQT